MIGVVPLDHEEEWECGALQVRCFVGLLLIGGDVGWIIITFYRG